MFTRKTRSGFTLIELLVVIAIIAILAAILFPVFAKAREKARQSQCANNVRQLLVAIQIYQQDHNDKFPNKDQVWQDVSFPPKTLVCPTYGVKKGNGYGYNKKVSDKTLQDPGMGQPQELGLICDSKAADHLLGTVIDIDTRHTNKATMGFADGHVVLGARGDFSDLSPSTDTELLNPQYNWPYSGNWAGLTAASMPANWSYNNLANNLGCGYYGGLGQYYNQCIILGGSYADYPGFGVTAGPAYNSFRIPLKAGATALGGKTYWVLNLPKFAFVGMGRTAAATTDISSWAEVSVLDNAATPLPIVTFRMEINSAADTTTWSFNGTPALEKDAASKVCDTMTGAWGNAIRVSKYSADPHDWNSPGNDGPDPTGLFNNVTFIASGGQLICSFNTPNKKDIGGSAIGLSSAGGDISKPTWLELKVKTNVGGGTVGGYTQSTVGCGGVALYNVDFGGGVLWGND